ncbi:phage baseplate upper protein [Enterococcus casseliflavus]|uniref:phage baseplate upper protein n=1 Tax=Enterococcus casseliflavus TaxID=37734 RepID=UPI0022E4C22D|nr:phage baseplate upper protein [Enterococcus casseliflavus]
MAVKYHVNLQTKEPNNNIGILRIRQSDEETQVLEVEVLDGALPMSYEGLQTFFCARIGQSPGLGIIEQKLTEAEMTDPKSGKLEYTFRAEDWQILGRQTGYFSFRKMTDDHTYEQQFSTRDFVYEVTKSIYSDGIKEVKKDGSTYVWTFEDLLRLLEEFKESGETDFIVWFNEIKDQLSEDAAGNLMLLYQSLRDKTGQDSDFRGFESDKSFMRRVFNENVERQGVNPKWFGATFNGVDDDGPAILAAHTYANENKLKVIYPRGEKTFLSNVKNIPIQTDVDFNGCTIIVDDSVNSEDDVFQVVNDSSSITLDTTDLQNGFGKETIFIPELAQYGECFVVVTDDTSKVFKRKGATNGQGVPKSDSFSCSNGFVQNRINFNYINISKIVVYPFNESPIKIENGKFVSTNNAPGTDYSLYYKRRFIVQRNQVTLSNLTHTLSKNSSNTRPSLGFIYHEDCAKQIVEQIELTPRKHTSSIGNYALGNSNVCDIKYINVNAIDDGDSTKWGAMGGNRFKNAIFDLCNLSRIDAHLGASDVVVTNCNLGKGGVTAVGFGALKIKHCKVKSTYFLRLRDDYGGSWEGDIEISDNEMIINELDTNNMATGISAKIYNSFDFGYERFLGKETIIIKNCRITTPASLIGLFVPICITTDASETPVNGNYKLAKEITLDSILTNLRLKVHSTDAFRLVSGQSEHNYKSASNSSLGYPSMTPNVKFVIKNMDMHIGRIPNPSYATADSSITNSSIVGSLNDGNALIMVSRSMGFVPSYIFDNCKNLSLTVGDSACELNVRNCHVRSMCNIVASPKSTGVISNSIFEPETNATTSLLNVLNCDKGYTISDCLIKNTIGTFAIDRAKYIYAFLYKDFGDRYTLPRCVISNCRVEPNPIFQSAYDRPVISSDGLRYIIPRSCQSNQLPAKAYVGQTIFDTTNSKLLVWSGSAWV